MLLAVVAALQGVHETVDALGVEGALEHVEDVAAPVDHVQDRDAVERARVGGLTPALRVEGGAVEDDRRPPLVLVPPHDRSVELQEVGVRAEEALGQGEDSTPKGPLRDYSRRLIEVISRGDPWP